MIEAAIRLVRRVRYAHRRVVALVVYGGIFTVSYAFAFLLAFDFAWPRQYTRVFLISLGLLLLVRLTASRAFRLSTSRWRFVGTHDVLRLAASIAVGTCLMVVLTRAPIGGPGVPLSVLIIEALVSAMTVGALWVGYRVAFEQLRFPRSGARPAARRVLLIGAGEAGSILARDMLRIRAGYRPIGFMDDDPHKWGTNLNGLEVIGGLHDLQTVAAATGADEIVIAVPRATPTQMITILERCEATGLPYRVLPRIAEVLAGHVSLTQLREVQIEDLLGRDPVRLDLPELKEDLVGRSVLVTGAAGSIGSELVRQIAQHSPGNLVLFDQAETELYYLELELRERFPELQLRVVVGDVVDPNAVERVFRAYSPDRVFHAAAYKHVPMMEANVREAIRNNVGGTHCVASAAGTHGAGKFILVSTDKAVRPASVMGAAKRLAEMIVLELQDRFPNTAYGVVRFGNVLGSNGSVIPIFRRQIAAGKPLTVTHPEATRYFMTIPEAVQLILQASLLPELRGHIAMLDMGEPVSIVDLARNLIRLSGVPGRVSENIVFTGLRPGERLHEELVAPDEETTDTAIPQVRIIKTQPAPDLPIADHLLDWDHAFAQGRDEEVIGRLRAMFPALQAGSTPTADSWPIFTPERRLAGGSSAARGR
jgi:FlaA1/EpsC-like NDP-sugar epimerase